MTFNYRYFTLCSFIFIITFLSSTALFCSNLTSTDDKNTPCFLELPTNNPVKLRTSGNSLVLPCHVARSKRSTVEWWYTDAQNLINIKIYPVFPAVRPTVLRFITGLTPYSKNSNETDIIDASNLLRHVNVDDSGIYRCIIRPWIVDSINNIEDIINNADFDVPALSYQVQLTGPRLCQPGPDKLPCFTAMRTSSPTIIDAYQTAFLQCVINNYNRPVSVFWVVGNVSTGNVLITEYLSTNQHDGDRLRRVFPLSPFDYSIELSVNRDIKEQVYSCVIDGAGGIETTLFTYIVRTIDLEEVVEGTKNGTLTRNGEKIVAHDTLNRQQIDLLRENKKSKTDEESLNEEDENNETNTENSEKIKKLFEDDDDSLPFDSPKGSTAI